MAQVLTPEKTILLIEENDLLRNALSVQLIDVGGYKVEQRKQISSSMSYGVDVWLLVVDTCSGELPTRFSRLPTIFLSGLGHSARRQVGSTVETLKKPFHIQELLSRIETIFSQNKDPEIRQQNLGQWTYDVASRSLQRAQAKKVKLTEIEAEILKVLWKKQGKIVLRETLIEDVWAHQPGLSTHRLETHIYRLRRKIEQDPLKPEIILTQVNGYQLNP